MSCPTGHPFLVGRCWVLLGVVRNRLWRAKAREGVIFEHDLFGKPVPTFPDHALLPHPVVAPIAFPAGQATFAELQIEPVLLVKKSAAADVAKREQDFVARAAADVIKGHAERGCGFLRIHAEKQRRIVRQRCIEGRWVGAADRRQALCACSCREREQQGRNGENSHDAAFRVCLASSPSRNGSTASIKACGWSILTAWPAAGITTFWAPGIFAAM